MAQETKPPQVLIPWKVTQRISDPFQRSLGEPPKHRGVSSTPNSVGLGHSTILVSGPCRGIERLWGKGKNEREFLVWKKSLRGKWTASVSRKTRWSRAGRGVCLNLLAPGRVWTSLGNKSANVRSGWAGPPGCRAPPAPVLCAEPQAAPFRTPSLVRLFPWNEISHVCLLFSFCLAVLLPVFACSESLVSGGPEVHGRHRKQAVR